MTGIAAAARPNKTNGLRNVMRSLRSPLGSFEHKCTQMSTKIVIKAIGPIFQLLIDSFEPKAHALEQSIYDPVGSRRPSSQTN